VTKKYPAILIPALVITLCAGCASDARSTSSPPPTAPATMTAPAATGASATGEPKLQMTGVAAQVKAWVATVPKTAGTRQTTSSSLTAMTAMTALWPLPSELKNDIRSWTQSLKQASWTLQNATASILQAILQQYTPPSTVLDFFQELVKKLVKSAWEDELSGLSCSLNSWRSEWPLVTTFLPTRTRLAVDPSHPGISHREISEPQTLDDLRERHRWRLVVATLPTGRVLVQPVEQSAVRSPGVEQAAPYRGVTGSRESGDRLRSASAGWECGAAGRGTCQRCSSPCELHPEVIDYLGCHGCLQERGVGA
jgi:hypothetical protein